MKRWAALLCLAGLGSPAALKGGSRYVSPAGNDANSGESAQAPVRTIGRALRDLGPGDTCWLASGIYRESVRLDRSGRPGAPITFAGAAGAVIDGADVVAGPWHRDSGAIWAAAAPAPLGLVLCAGAPLTEARWPHASWAENWLPERKWARTGSGSRLGELHCAALADAGIDLSGGRVCLKLSKGNSCYSRPILGAAGRDGFTWDARGLPGRAWREDALPERIAKFGLVGNRFYVVAPGALSVPGEWGYDHAHGELRVIAPDRGMPGPNRVEVKVREWAFAGSQISDVVFRQLEFRACGIDLRECRGIRVEDCVFAHPAGSVAIPDQAAEKAFSRPAIHLQGEDLAVIRTEVAGAFGIGIALEGDGMRAEACVIHDVDWDGSHPCPAISLLGVAPPDGSAMHPNRVTQCTCYRFGGVGIYAYGDGPARIDHNDLFDGGLYCTDDSAIYVPTGERMAGSEVDHNWIHAQHGIGLRVDQLGRGIAFHHNLVWATLAGCKLEGLALTAFNNTVLADDPATDFPFIVVFDRSATPADLGAWRVQRNVAVAFVDRNALRPSEAVPNRPFLRPLAERPPAFAENIAIGRGPWSAWFVDPAHEDFRPRAGGPLDRPDGTVGALDRNAPPWPAGAGWLPRPLPPPLSPAASSRLAADLLPEPMDRYGPAQQ